MKSNEEKLMKDIEEKNEEISRIQEEHLQELHKTKQPDSLPTEVNKNVSAHVCMHVCNKHMIL